ncbi:MAG: B12-binding domain-containing radical SAM protein [Lentisphaeraceae bacterium]|nr:B12-binding domain-containing radical SAM protein [Lentisphaeraceae bacterium]
MKITFLSVNCSYSHTSMAYHLLKGYSDPDEVHDWEMVECSINEKVENVLRQLNKSKPDWILASCYIFNHTELFEILRRYVCINPDVTVILGGPEFLGNNEALLREFPWIDLLVRGEGEIPFKRVLQGDKWGHIKGLVWIDEEGRYRDNKTADLADMDLIIPHYSKMFAPDRPFVQYETSRGCPNRCSFCTSSLDPVLRYIPLDAVRDHLKIIQEAGIKEVRILDRTFNSKNSRACDLLKMFREEFSDIRFHCEVDPAFIQDSLFEEMAKAPKGQLHLEAGLQTFSEDTYDIVKRISPMNKTTEGLQRLCSMDNIEIHADLIGGLPGCTYESQYNDLMTLIKLKPSEIQLENLKILPGLPMAELDDIAFSPTPPYEILRTSEMSYEDLCRVSNWSKIIDRFYNYHPLRLIIIELVNYDVNSFDKLHDFIDSHEGFSSILNPKNRFKILKDFVSTYYSHLLPELAKAWYMAGFSPENGLFPAKQIKIEDNGSFIYSTGEVPDYIHRSFQFDVNDKSLVIQYGKGHINSMDTKRVIWEIDPSLSPSTV